MKYLLCLFFFFFRIFEVAEARERQCFLKHLQQASSINKQRMPLYAQLSDGKFHQLSLKISKRLIRDEAFMIFSIKYLLFFDFDKMFQPWVSAGINITCESFAPMDTVPNFTGYFEDGANPSAANFVKINPSILSRRLRHALNEHELEDFLRIVKEQLLTLNREQHLNCLTRHLLSSLARIAALTPDFVTRSREKNLPSPENLIYRLLKNHLIFLPSFVETDTLASTLNEKGINILCGDLPEIIIP